MKYPKKKIIIKKENNTTDITTDDSTTDSFVKDSDYTSDVVNEYIKGDRFLTLLESNYNIPKNGTIQDNLTSEQILDKLKNYVPLKTLREKEVLTTLQPFKTWIKYINKDSGKFRNGGLLMKVVYPDYIMLINSVSKLTWSVQLKDNIIFVKHPKIIEKEKEQEIIKEELYQLYLEGKLKRIK